MADRKVLLREFQDSIVGLVKLFAEQGAPFEDLRSLVINLSAVMTQSAGQSADNAIAIFKHYYELALHQKKAFN